MAAISSQADFKFVVAIARSLFLLFLLCVTGASCLIHAQIPKVLSEGVQL